MQVACHSEDCCIATLSNLTNLGCVNPRKSSTQACVKRLNRFRGDWLELLLCAGASRNQTLKSVDQGRRTAGFFQEAVDRRRKIRARRTKHRYRQIALQMLYLLCQL